MAGCGAKRANAISSGTMTSPPPTPKSAAKKPAALPIPTNVRSDGARPRIGRMVSACPTTPWSRSGGTPARRPSCSTSTGRSLRSPPHPADAGVPAETIEVLVRLVGRFGLVGCVSGRAAADARSLVPVPGIAFSGNHGLEIAEGDAVLTVPDAEPYIPAMADLVRRLAPIAAGAGAWIEDKGVTLAVHYRQAPDPEDAEAQLQAAGRAADRRRGPERPLRPDGAGGAPAGADRQGHGGAPAAARARPRAQPVRRRRHDRPRRLPRRRRLRRRRLAGGAARPGRRGARSPSTARSGARELLASLLDGAPPAA